ncbi:MAG: HAMP domain-containing sensor histidine kinase, partial [Nitrospinota bacterium]
KGEVRITTKKIDNKIEITFADTGLGISEDKVSNIFKPFFTTKAEGKGTGLGLSIAKDIIEKYGGKIELENKVGEGVKFIITLPVS